MLGSRGGVEAEAQALSAFLSLIEQSRDSDKLGAKLEEIKAATKDLLIAEEKFRKAQTEQNVRELAIRDSSKALDARERKIQAEEQRLAQLAQSLNGKEAALGERASGLDEIRRTLAARELDLDDRQHKIAEHVQSEEKRIGQLHQENMTAVENTRMHHQAQLDSRESEIAAREKVFQNISTQFKALLGIS